MVSREECKDAINKFIKTSDINDVLILIDYLCQVKEISGIEKDKTIRHLTQTFGVLPIIIPNILEELERHFNLIRVTDINNNIIIVF